MSNVTIGKRVIGKNEPCFIIAELSANHRHDINIAMEIIHEAAKAGSDAVKLQTYTPDTITFDSNNKHFQIKGTLWDGRTLHNLYKEAYMPWEWQPQLKEKAEALGMVCFSSPFDPTAVDFLEEMNVPAYKIASFEITDIPLIRYVASKGKPVIISTGIANEEDIELAVQACRDEGNDQLVLLKCTSAYPAPMEDIHLNAIPLLREKFGVIPGLSDHSLGIEVPIASVALGAKVIEKHLTLRRSDGGPDAAFSLEPHEFKAMIDAVRNAEKALGKKELVVTDKMKKGRAFSRSLFIVKDVQKGDLLSAENVRSIRPGTGLHPRYYNEVLGKKAKRDLEKGTPLSFDDVERV